MTTATMTAPLSEPSVLDIALDHPAVRPVVEIYKWATEHGLRGANAETLFDGYCRSLVVLWRPSAARPRVDADAASAMERLRLHVAPAGQRLNVQVFLRSVRSQRSSGSTARSPTSSSARMGGERNPSTCAAGWRRGPISATFPRSSNSTPRARPTITRLSRIRRKRRSRARQGRGLFVHDRRAGRILRRTRSS